METQKKFEKTDPLMIALTVLLAFSLALGIILLASVIIIEKAI